MGRPFVSMKSRWRCWSYAALPPIHTVHIAGKNERPLKTRRSENLPGSRGFDFVGAQLPLLRFYAPSVFRSQVFRYDGNGGGRLRRPGHFTGNVALENRAFLNREERGAGKPVLERKPGPFLWSWRLPAFHPSRQKAWAETRRRSPIDRDERPGSPKLVLPCLRADPLQSWPICCHPSGCR